MLRYRGFEGGGRSRHWWGWGSTTASNSNFHFSAIPELLRDTATIRGNLATSRKVTSRTEPHRPRICTIPGREAAVSCKIVPLQQYEISTKTIGKLELMMKEVIVGRSFLGGILRPRNVCPTGIERVSGCIVEFIRDEHQRMRIEAFLCSNFTSNNRARLYLEMSQMVGREDTLDINDRSFFVAFLDDLN